MTLTARGVQPPTFTESDDSLRARILALRPDWGAATTVIIEASGQTLDAIAHEFGLAREGEPFPRSPLMGFQDEGAGREKRTAARRPAKSYMARNRDIVNAAERMIATPYESSERTSGGTWRTIAMARQASKPLYIVWPDGRVTEERVK